MKKIIFTLAFLLGCASSTVPADQEDVAPESNPPSYQPHPSTESHSGPCDNAFQFQKVEIDGEIYYIKIPIPCKQYEDPSDPENDIEFPFELNIENY